jgi:hypothetical protein
VKVYSWLSDSKRPTVTPFSIGGHPLNVGFLGCLLEAAALDIFDGNLPEDVADAALVVSQCLTECDKSVETLLDLVEKYYVMKGGGHGN